MYKRQSYDHAKGVLVGLCMAQSATGAEAALEAGFVSLAGTVRVLVIAAAFRTAAVVDGSLRSAAHAASEAFEAAGGMAAGVFEAVGLAVSDVLEAVSGLVEGVSEAVVDLVQSAAWSFGGLLRDTCETVAFAVRVAAVLLVGYVALSLIHI